MFKFFSRHNNITTDKTQAKDKEWVGGGGGGGRAGKEVDRDGWWGTKVYGILIFIRQMLLHVYDKTIWHTHTNQ